MSRAASMRREPKSTLIKVLAGVVTPDAGELTLFGESATFPLGAGESYRRGLRARRIYPGAKFIPTPQTFGEV